MIRTDYRVWRTSCILHGSRCTTGDAVKAYDQYYTDKENTRAGYVMSEFNVGSDLTIIPGVRYQEERSDISAYHIRPGINLDGLDGTAPVLVETKREILYRILGQCQI